MILMKNAKRFTAIILSALMAASVFSAVTVSAKTMDGEVTAVSEDLENDDYMYTIRYRRNQVLYG